ncbi:hypothetical protein UlMin_004098 [Ulmus minor]
MKNLSLLKREFLKKWIKGLQICNLSSKKMGIFERKNAIKLSADLAMASARKGRTNWSRAIIAKATQNKINKPADSKLFVSRENKLLLSRQIRKRSNNVRRTVRRSLAPKALPISIAKRLIHKKTQVLKSLVPGGESMDEISLIKETLDYIVSLRAQVDVMRYCLARASQELVNGDKN